MVREVVRAVAGAALRAFAVMGALDATALWMMASCSDAETQAATPGQWSAAFVVWWQTCSAIFIMALVLVAAYRSHDLAAVLARGFARMRRA